MTENEGDPVWLSVTQPRPTPMLYACPTPIPPVCCSQGCCLAGGHGASTPFAFNKEPGSSLGRWTALSTWGISVPKNMPAFVKTRCRKASSSTSAGLVSSVLALAKTPFMLNSYSWWELSLTSSKGRKLLVSFSKSCQMNKALQERLSGEHPDSSVSPQGTGFGEARPSGCSFRGFQCSPRGGAVRRSAPRFRERDIDLGQVTTLQCSPSLAKFSCLIYSS